MTKYFKVFCSRCMERISIDERFKFNGDELISYPAFCKECGFEIKRKPEIRLTRKERILLNKNKELENQ